MPINDPIKDRKVAPNSLAFPMAGGTRGGSSTSYQQTVQNIVNNTVVQANADSVEDLRRGLTVADRDAEKRAKAWVSKWHRVVDWDITGDVEITNNMWNPITFHNESMRAMGAEAPGSPIALTWRWVVPSDWEGTYFLYSFISISVQAAAAVTEARLGIAVNNTLRTLVDRADIEMAGDHVAHMRDVVLRGGRNISVAPHDVVTVCLNLVGAAGTDTYTNPTSVTGYVSGFRTMCGYDHIIGSPDDIQGYTFT